MGDFNPVFIVFFLVLVALVFLIFKRTNSNYKPSYLKKQELVKQYEYEMLKLISKYEKEPEVLKIKKIEFLKQASNELHNNIFFEDKEAKALVQKLASL